MEEQFNIPRMIDERISGIAIPELEKLFYHHAGKSISTLKIVVASIGFGLGCIEILLIRQGI